MAKIIRFPEKNDKIPSVKKANQKALLFVSLSSLILFAIVFNLSYQSNIQKTRNIANVPTSDEQVEGTSALNGWILTNLNSSNAKNEIVFSEKANAKDQLIFASLMGRYDIIKSQDMITELNLKAGSKPVKFAQLPSLLDQYRQANGIENLEFELIKDKDLEHVYEMRSSAKKLGLLRLKFSKNKGLVSIQSTWN